VEYVVHGAAAAKPRAWARGEVLPGPATSPLSRLLSRLLATPEVARHYGRGQPQLTDELPLIYLLHPELFAARGVQGRPQRVLDPRDAAGILGAFSRLGREGRQRKRRVVLSPAELPPTSLQPDVRRRRRAIIRNNGRVEWLAQLLQCELHRHLGIYSIVGVKMALRAAELLNAPQHGMQVTSLASDRPPHSCLNDGLITAVGSTPGRGLFRAGPPGERIRARFSYNGRQVTLTLRQRRQQQVDRELARLRRRHGLSSPRYWAAVRRRGLEIWQSWHRTELFEEQLRERGPAAAPR
jgi:pyrimidine-specific ribonucleoside hydrolase